ncbi:hypothetical protein COB21_04935 [Candidatus Aerophobetes bacterium]|uniref:RDD domain-containing protein n=1 Tax=Aerophobetes bacterium TaxID=2030807 RepID=A0A2A4X1X4_UNCAE|nr:MAG: hypothetical protein COB21_04935 [Candidatus Aerophobetes bacterium]
MVDQVDTDFAPVKSCLWRRFFARSFDYLFFILVLLILTHITPLRFTSFHPYFFISVIFFWIFIETFLLSTVGTTPGKWLLSMHVSQKNGKKLSLRDSLHRSVSVWWLGLAAGVPIICLVTMLVASVKLSSTGTCSWDKMEGYKVSHKKLNPFKVLVFLVILASYFWFMSFNVNYVLSFF